MIAPSFGITATERVLPKLALDFTTASLDSRVTFTRTTGASNPASYFNSSGVLSYATNDQPRFDFNPDTLACKGLLIEESRTNIVLQSNVFTNGAWAKTRCAASAFGAALDNVGNYFRLLCNTTSVSGFNTVQAVTRVASTTYSQTVYLKKGTSDWAALNLSDGSTNSFRQFFNLSTGTLGTSVPTGWTGSATIEAIKDGWYRCTVAIATTTGTTANFAVFPSVAADENIACTSGDVGYLQMAQLEAGTFATSYIPTTTTALTRNADVATMTGTNFSDWYNQSEGAMQIIGNPVAPASSGAGMTAGQLYQATGNFISVSMGVAKRPRLQVYVGGSLVLTAVASSDINAPFNQVAALKSGSISFASNATVIATNSAQNIPTSMNSFGIGYDIFNARGGNIWVQKVNYWPMKLTNAETLAFSK